MPFTTIVAAPAPLNTACAEWFEKVVTLTTSPLPSAARRSNTPSSVSIDAATANATEVDARLASVEPKKYAASNDSVTLQRCALAPP